jgi:DNA replication protein DnaC
MRRVYMDVVRRAEEDSWSYRDFLALLVREEVAHRTQTRLQRFTRRARFPYLKTIDDFDFSHQSSLRASVKSLFVCRSDVRAQGVGAPHGDVYAATSLGCSVLSRDMSR